MGLNLEGEENLKDLLPEKFEESHNFAMYLHDSLVQIVQTGEQKDIFNSEIIFDSESEAEEMSGLSGEELWSWLDNKDEDLIKDLSYKQIFVAVLTDLCQFVFESLQTSRKGKLTVSFALLRKPFRDDLLILEWLLADAAAIVKKFHNGKPEEYAIESTQSEEKKEIIKNAIQNLPENHGFGSDFIYRSRYDKEVYWSLAKVWNKALHIVTTHPEEKTEEQNLNFVFSTPKDKISQWKYLYWITPILLYHTVEVAEALMATIANINKTQDSVRRLTRRLNLLFWQKSTSYFEEPGELRDLIEDIQASVDLTCPECSAEILMDEENVKSFAEIGEVSCRNCDTVLDLKSYFTDP